MKPVFVEIKNKFLPGETTMLNLCMIEQIVMYRDADYFERARLLLSSGAKVETEWTFSEAVRKIDELWEEHEIKERKAFLGASE